MSGVNRRQAVTACASFWLAMPATASAGRWTLLGERSVRLLGDRDEILVTAARGTMRRIRLRVLDQGVEFFDVTVHFASGERFEAQLRHFIQAGGQTRAIDLPGRDRVIRRVSLTYRTRRGADTRARVQLWGWS
jgi:hypothetical protein